MHTVELYARKIDRESIFRFSFYVTYIFNRIYTVLAMENSTRYEYVIVEIIIVGTARIMRTAI